MSNVRFQLFINLRKQYNQLQWLLSILLQRKQSQKEKKKGMKKTPRLAGDQWSYCTGNRLETFKSNLVIHIFKY